MVAEFTIINHK